MNTKHTGLFTYTKRRVLFTALLIVVIVTFAVSTWAAMSKSDSSKTSQSSASTASQKSMEVASPVVPETSQSTAAKAGTYVIYKPGIIQETSGTKILFFHADWCPQCRKLETSIKNSSLPDNTTIIKVDYDDSNDLKKKYGVTIQTTLVKVSDDGTLLEKYVAYEDPTFAAVQKALL